MRKDLVLPLSPTRLSILRSCLLRFKKKYVDKIPGARTQLLLEGVFIHEVAERYRQWFLFAGNQEHDMEVFDQIFKDTVEDHPDVSNPYGIYWVARKACHLPIDPGEAIAVELGITIDLDCSVIKKEVPKEVKEADPFAEIRAGHRDATRVNRRGFLTGKIDLLGYRPETRTLLVSDLKTGWGRTFKPLQTKIYGLLGLCVFPQAENVLVIMQTPRVSAPEPVSYKKETLYKFARSLESEINDYLQATEFEATPGTACAYCEFRSVCDYKAPEYETLNTKEEAEEAYRGYLFHKAQAKNLKEMCRDWVEENGVNIITGDAMLGFDVSTSETMPKGLFLQACDELGISTAELGLLKNDVKKLIKKNPELEEKAKELWIREEKSRFSAEGTPSPDDKKKWENYNPKTD